MQPKYTTGSDVRIVHRTLGEQHATVVKRYPLATT